MWLLRNDAKGQVYRVTPSKHHIVSRKDGDLLLVGDQSISRKHAQIFVNDENGNEGLCVQDLGSKYGTFTVIGQGELTQVAPNNPVTIKNDDCVRFGIQFNSWRAEFVPLLVATSTLSQEEKSEVKRLVAELGGKVLSDWHDKCSHLTMNKLTVTVKVVCALASGQPIVTPAYWTAFTEALSSMQTTLPDCKDFLPPLAEAMLNPAEVSFTPNPARSKLFNGYTFVAATAKQLTRIKLMITAAGGTAVEFSAKSWTEKQLTQENLVLMQHPANDRQGSQQSQIPDGYIPVARKLRACGIRCIPESEIGLSVLYCSLSQYCNTRYSAQSLIGSSSLKPTQPVNVICPNSEDSLQNIADLCTQPNSKKRHHQISSDEEECEAKKVTLDTVGNSEDLFSSQNVNISRKSSSPSKKSLTLRKSSSPSGLMNGLKEKVPTINPAPSLDMFAPSGEKNKPSSTHDQNHMRPSCEDLFGSGGNKRPQERSSTDNNDCFSFSSSRKSKKRDREAEPQDEFSFSSNSKFKKPHGQAQPQDDFFSFSSNKKSKKPNGEEKTQDELSFTSNKKARNAEVITDEINDEFSFVSSKKNKRARGSDPDMFASSGESSNNNNNSIAGPSKIRKTNDLEEFRCREAKKVSSKDNVFAFPSNEVPKKKAISLFKTSSEIKIGLFSKKDEAIPGPSNLYLEQEGSRKKDSSISENLVTYSKLKQFPVKIKEDICDEEVDELTKELYNATIVVVKPLVVARPKPVETISAVTTLKNFKKFRKVVGINKRAVPMIIGGSDLVAHSKICEPPDELAPPSPEQPSPQDDWAFQKNTKKLKGSK